MIKYLYLVKSEDHWFDVAKHLYQEKIAKPVLWIGDDSHYNKASELFKDNILKRLDFVFYPYKIRDISYNGEHSDFLFSTNYLIAKDRCLKMLDRLDLNASFTRIDRETYFHSLTLYLLKSLYNSKPDVLIAAEAPHNHANYLIYEISKFLDIPTYFFKNWNLGPLLYLQNMKSGKIISTNISDLNNTYEEVEDDIKKYIRNLKKNSDNYELSYMIKQRKESKFIYRIINFFKLEKKISSTFLSVIKDIRFNTLNLIYRKYDPINPLFFNFISRTIYKFIRRKNLNLASKKAETKVDLNKKYIYYALHYEPERSTNPDGNEFHDQFIAICELRRIIPQNYKIYVKEHPWQLFSQNPRGVYGRSPLFYNLIKNIEGVEIAKTSTNTIELIKNSEFVSTITGTVAIEAAILGKKALVFGKTYLDDCPNIFYWKKDISFEYIKNTKLYSEIDIETFLLKKIRNLTIPAFQNFSQRSYFKKYNNNQFDKIQTENIKSLMTDFFKTKKYQK